MTVLCLVEREGDGAADVSLRALTFARSLGQVTAAVFGDTGSVPVTDLSAYGVANAYAVESDDLTGYAPQAWARALAGLAADLSATAVVGRAPTGARR